MPGVCGAPSGHSQGARSVDWGVVEEGPGDVESRVRPEVLPLARSGAGPVDGSVGSLQRVGM